MIQHNQEMEATHERIVDARSGLIAYCLMISQRAIHFAGSQ